MNSSLRPWRAWVWVGILGVCLPVLGVSAQTCSICGLPLVSTVYLSQDRYTGETREICSQCFVLKDRCYLCGLPVKREPTVLEDGRVLCARDAREVIVDPEAARRVCFETQFALDRLFSRFLEFPKTNVVIDLVDRIQMEQLLQTPGFERQCPSILGYVRSRIVQGGAWRHPISLLSGLPRERMMAVLAHETAHTWVRENVPVDRLMDRNAEEGFCELIAWYLMKEIQSERERKYIESNAYTRGQARLFIEADAVYGFYTVTEWMKGGLDPLLMEEDLDRIRRVEPRPAAREAPVKPVALRYGPTPVPDTLSLKGISRTPGGLLVLINDRVFKPGETGSVRVARTSVVVECLSITSNSVMIRVEGEGAPRQLQFKSDAPPVAP